MENKQTFFEQQPVVGEQGLLDVRQQPPDVLPVKKPKYRWMWLAFTVVFIGVITAIFINYQKRSNNNVVNDSSAKTQDINLSSVSPSAVTFTMKNNDSVVVNGQLQATGGLVLNPGVQPKGDEAGLIYVDRETGRLRYFDGANYYDVAMDSGNICTQGGDTCSYATVDETQVLIQAALGTLPSGISLPQDLATTSSPAFAGLTVSGGGTFGNLSVTGNASVTGNLLLGSTTLINGSGSAISFTLPAADGAASQCLTTNGAGALGFSACSAGAGTAFVQGGNSFGATATLGTNDSNSLVFRTNGVSQATLAVGGALTLQNSIDSTSALNVLNSTSATVFNVDTTNGRVGIGTATPQTKLSVVNTSLVAQTAFKVNQENTAQNIIEFQSNGTDVFTLGGTGSAVFQNTSDMVDAFRVNDDSGTAVLAVNNTWGTLGAVGIGTNGPTAKLSVVGIGNATGDTLRVSNSTSTGNIAIFADNTTTVATIADGGTVKLQNSVNSSTAFQIQNAAGAQLFNIDTSNNVITMNGNTSAELQPWVTNGASLSSAVKAHGTVTAGGYIYAIGGVESGAHTNTVRYAPINANGSIGSWSTTTALPATRSYSAVVAHGGFIYVIGGYDNAESVSSTVYYARANSDGTLSSWQTSDNKLNTSVGAAGAVVANGYLYLTGGGTGKTGTLSDTGQPSSAQTTVQYARINSDGTIDPFTSTTGSSLLPAVRVGGRAIAANGYMYYTGGQDAALTAQASIYHVKLNIDGSLDSGGWTTSGCSLNVARAYHGLTTLNGYLYIFGGGSDAGTGSTTAQYATLNSNGTLTCSGGVFTSTTNSMASSTVDFGYAAANGYMYAVGGTGLSAIQYASGPRVYIASSLDLVSFTGENLATGGSGGTLTVGETRVVGTLQVSDEASFLQGVRVGGNLHVAGQATFRNNVDSSTALVIQNAAGSSILSFDTANNTVQPGFSSSLAPRTRSTNQITYLSHDIAQSMSSAIGSDKLPIIAALDQTDGKIVVAKCLDDECLSYSTKGGLGTGTVTGTFNVSMTTGSQDGLPVIAYREAGNNDLYVLHCGNTTCTSGNVDRAVHTSGQVGAYPTIIMGADNLPFIAYRHAGNSDLYTIHCGDPTCDPTDPEFVGPTLVSGSGTIVGAYTSVEIGYCSDGSYGCPVIAHFRQDGGGDDLQVTLCADIVCSAVTSDTTITTTGTGGGATAITMMPDGKPFVVIANTSNQLIGVRCSAIGCTSTTSNSVIAGDIASAQGVTMTRGEDNYPIIAYKNTTPDLAIRQCTNGACTTATVTTINLGGANEGQYASISKGEDGFPLITWSASSGNTAINVTHCISQSCASTSATIPTGGVTLGTSSLRFGGINVDAINPGNDNSYFRLFNDGKFISNSLISNNDGTVYIQSTSATAFGIVNTDTANDVLVVDTANARLGINTSTPANRLSVNGLSVADATAQVAISTGLLTNKGLVVQGAGFQTANLTEWQNSSGTIMASIGATGAALFKNSSDSTTAFQIQNATGTGLLTVDTSNSRVGIGTDAPAATLHVSGNTMIIGEGHGGTPTATIIQGATAAGTDVAGADLYLDASNGTGIGGSGRLVLRTAKSAATGSITVDANTSTDTGVSSQSSLTWSHTVASSSNRILIVGVSLKDGAGQTVSTVTFNGVSLTKLTAVTSSNARAEIWYLINPPAGLADVVVTPSASARMAAGATSYYNVNQATPFGTAATASDDIAPPGSSTATVTVSSEPDELVIDMLAKNNSDSAPVPDSSQTSRWSDVTTDGTDSANNTYGASSSKPGALSTTMSWSWTTNRYWALIAVPLKPVGGSTGNSMAEVFSLNNDGRAILQNSVNSTTAFQVQNAAGSTIFNVDTSNSKVGTPDTATDSTNSNAFVLQSGNASGTTSNSGNVTIDVGTATGTLGVINIGTTNALTVTIGKSGATLTVDSNATFNGTITVASAKNIKFAGTGNAQNVLSKQFLCTAATTTGDLVIIDTVTAGQLTTSAATDSPLVAGVVVTGVGAGATCEVALTGVIQVNVDTGAVGIGDLIVSSGATAGMGKTNNTPAVGTVLGKALSAKAGGSNGTVWILLQNN